MPLIIAAPTLSVAGSHPSLRSIAFISGLSDLRRHQECAGGGIGTKHLIQESASFSGAQATGCR